MASNDHALIDGDRFADVNQVDPEDCDACGKLTDRPCLFHLGQQEGQRITASAAHVVAVIAHEVAGRLRERAGWHDATAETLSVNDAGLPHRLDAIRWHRSEASALRDLAAREVSSLRTGIR